MPLLSRKVGRENAVEKTFATGVTVMSSDIGDKLENQSFVGSAGTNCYRVPEYSAGNAEQCKRYQRYWIESWSFIIGGVSTKHEAEQTHHKCSSTQQNAGYPCSTKERRKSPKDNNHRAYE